MFSALFPGGNALLSSFADAVMDGVVVAAIIAAFTWLTSLSDRRRARRQLADCLLRVFCMKQVGPREVQYLGIGSIRGWDALPRLEACIDLYRKFLKTGELLDLQDLIGHVHLGAKPTSASRLMDLSLSQSVLGFFPGGARKRILEHFNQRSLQDLRWSIEESSRLGAS